MNKKLEFIGFMFKGEKYQIGKFALQIFEWNCFRSKKKALKFLMSGNTKTFNWEGSFWDE